MRAKYKGRDGDLNLKKGVIYDIRPKNNFIRKYAVEIQIFFEDYPHIMLTNCAYGSFEKLFENWEFDI